MPNSNRRLLPALSAISLMALSACGDGEQEVAEGEERVSNETLASLLANAESLSTVSAAMDETGLLQIFDGPASYTVLAPSDAAFEALGPTGEQLRAPERRPLLIAVLRDHIVPGYLTEEDIRNAIQQRGGTVEMSTMGDHVLTFSEEDGVISVSNEDGATGRIDGPELRGENGVVMPLDAVLRTFDTGG